MLAFFGGKGRNGRLVLFREFPANGIVPVAVEEARSEYLEALKNTEMKNVRQIELAFEKEQKFY